MKWVNTGDINPASGAAFMRDPSIDQKGDFSAEVIDTVPETTVGGDEKRILLRQGTVHLASAKIESALATVGARLSGTNIIRPGHHGKDEGFPMNSEEGLLELFAAAYAYGGIELDFDVLVQIGEDETYDQDRKFAGDLFIFKQGTSVWSILERQMDGFDYPHEEDPAELLRVEEAPSSEDEGCAP